MHKKLLSLSRPQRRSQDPANVTNQAICEIFNQHYKKVLMNQLESSLNGQGAQLMLTQLG